MSRPTTTISTSLVSYLHESSIPLLNSLGGVISPFLNLNIVARPLNHLDVIIFLLTDHANVRFLPNLNVIVSLLKRLDVIVSNHDVITKDLDIIISSFTKCVIRRSLLSFNLVVSLLNNLDAVMYLLIYRVLGRSLLSFDLIIPLLNHLDIIISHTVLVSGMRHCQQLGVCNPTPVRVNINTLVKRGYTHDLFTDNVRRFADSLWNCITFFVGDLAASWPAVERSELTFSKRRYRRRLLVIGLRKSLDFRRRWGTLGRWSVSKTAHAGGSEDLTRKLQWSSLSPSHCRLILSDLHSTKY